MHESHNFRAIIVKLPRFGVWTDGPNAHFDVRPGCRKLQCEKYIVILSFPVGSLDIPILLVAQKIYSDHIFWGRLSVLACDCSATSSWGFLAFCWVHYIDQTCKELAL